MIYSKFMSFEEVIDQALTLPLEQRSRLASVLINSLECNDDAPLSPQWLQEIKKRARELENGSVEGLSLQDFENYVEKQLG
ncbi:MAG: addiction module protein [Methylacidiphilales bacterium]|nr:addiction module protein [Candidatus Methylacidiphilales bacterium]